MKIQTWGIALIRYESSKSFYITSLYELAEVVEVIQDRYYTRIDLAERTISRWESVSLRRLPEVPAPITVKMENGRYQFYRWAPIPIHEDGIPGFSITGKKGAFQRIEHPYINDMAHPDRFHVDAVRWPENRVVWFDLDAWVKAYNGAEKPEAALPDRDSDLYYSARDFILDRDQMVTALSESIDVGSILQYSEPLTEKSFYGQVVAARKIPADNSNRVFMEWDVNRLDEKLLPVHPEEFVQAMMDTVVPRTLLRVVWIPFPIKPAAS